MDEKKPKTKSKFWGVSIEAPKENPSIDTLRGYQDIIAKQSDLVFYATIIHDRDKKENGEPRKPHLHAFLNMAEGKTLTQMLKWLETALNCDREAISIEPSNNEFLLVQYLIHKNHPNKASYKVDEIRTNNNELLIDRLSKEYVKPKSDEEELAEAMTESVTLKEFATRIGFEKANKYRGMFNQLKTEEGQSYDIALKRAEQLRKERDEIASRFIELIKQVQDPLFKPNYNQLERLALWLDMIISS